MQSTPSSDTASHRWTEFRCAPTVGSAATWTPEKSSCVVGGPPLAMGWASVLLGPHVAPAPSAPGGGSPHESALWLQRYDAASHALPSGSAAGPAPRAHWRREPASTRTPHGSSRGHPRPRNTADVLRQIVTALGGQLPQPDPAQVGLRSRFGLDDAGLALTRSHAHVPLLVAERSAGTSGVKAT